ncbi:MULTISPECIES: RNase adapter RapZ [unclassified Oleiphilus]|uniref:RNase adapter RapZ n=1 Tax=unclassified Oleiphilus TaxID=2631174 RepID=UPI0007C30302|nr:MULTISPECIES: RNase adapter RapZ [unclassified Oleiphilus]KZY44135.1 RNase adaptor protein RapZ [Oleiphilus sp. HI0050]KZZ34126.1 RNase adaptor protein RapZ [Oleiphilus sp. HI0086]KZZ38469.1 RNase adaptor protein RapZ [Oleiphilus sp. HI0117]KZZ55740.1 RNase adaptor protein RapZ [Oleiphilus sp. HI0123]
MKLVIVSGRSGSGKSTALHVLEDMGYYCIDNLPVGLLLNLGKQSLQGKDTRLSNVSISIDARNLQGGIEAFPQVYEKLKQMEIDVDIIFLDAQSETLLKRFHDTRRKHPLSSTTHSLTEAIETERTLLDQLALKADLTVDTTKLTLYELRDLIKLRVTGKREQELAILFQSFGFKNGVPSDADYVFDVRCLPNPYWDPNLRTFSGLDKPVVDFMNAQPESILMKEDIINFLSKWLPQFKASNRSYMTIAIGCTGGHHRSVYISEQLGAHFKSQFDNVQIRHKELPSPHKT